MYKEISSSNCEILKSFYFRILHIQYNIHTYVPIENMLINTCIINIT